ncbi:alpha-glucuronidase [Paenibacillus sp. CGMCC 1.16610]|uniref:Xylan alpha-1,2-glucuronidase n=1 Tax=Paenibacillus anseongense TaxID=2682845 RepID=A0ABW9UFH4_9BACL|nr:MULTISPECIES: alpha-glucuronidase family glycosyl hydrolase [Paenibacillus]MBA2944217.1 alpha-glucuronidase [Paenibacillus sp. CGMCC 1.16610]MVQ38107.1 alpha-glucuronidase [Paenibacillus anseongense]
MSDTTTQQTGYQAWLEYHPIALNQVEQYAGYSGIVCTEKEEAIQTAVQELSRGISKMLGKELAVSENGEDRVVIALGTFGGGNALVDRVFDEGARSAVKPEGFAIKTDQASGSLVIGASSASGVLYGVFHLLRLISTHQSVNQLDVIENPVNMLRMINQWDNIDGSIERGYAGKSIFFENNRITTDLTRVRDYARLLASSGLNAISINNVNVHHWETKFLTGEYLPDVARVAGVFRSYGIKLFLSVNYASPLEIGGLSTADPLDPAVREWWRVKAAEVYAAIPDFGGFLVKADSENRPGPFTYDRDHADGSNMLAEALKPYGGIVIWRCFVYNCKQDWRDRATDRARAAYDHFKPLDGRFMDNVILQVKNGPMDFQVREPVSPLIGAMETTNQMIEFQITQEYTGQQRHLCYLVPQWKEVLDFETYVKGDGSSIKRIVDGSLYGNRFSGFAAVSNIGNDTNWTGHLLAQANLYGYARLAWNPELSAEEIAEEWIRMALGGDEKMVSVVMGMLMDSWSIYEAYTSPLGVGWMVNPDHHYGPNVDGYEYSKWGTYHFADCHGIGVDRTKATGTGYAAQYKGMNYDTYESVENCPDELLLFFHHVPYTHVLHSGQTVIQHIYNTHFEGVERAEQLVAKWASLEGSVGELVHKHVADRLAEQAAHAQEWRDMINTYFFRKSGIADALGRKIY